MSFARQVSIGRVALVQFPEAEAGQLVVISDVVSPNAVSWGGAGAQGRRVGHGGAPGAGRASLPCPAAPASGMEAAGGRPAALDLLEEAAAEAGGGRRRQAAAQLAAGALSSPGAGRSGSMERVVQWLDQQCAADGGGAAVAWSAAAAAAAALAAMMLACGCCTPRDALPQQ